MSTKIDGYKSLLTHITVVQDVQFHRDVTGQIDPLDPLVPQVSGIVPAFETYKSDSKKRYNSNCSDKNTNKVEI
jgi:hypothetical protein